MMGHNWLYVVAGLAAALALPLACGWGAPGDDFDLRAPGYVKCSGGCISHVASTLTFTPLKNGDVLVRHAGDFFNPEGVSEPRPWSTPSTGRTRASSFGV